MAPPDHHDAWWDQSIHGMPDKMRGAKGAALQMDCSAPLQLSLARVSMQCLPTIIKGGDYQKVMDVCLSRAKVNKHGALQ